MDQRAVLNMEVEKNGHRYVFSMPIGAPLGESYDAVYSVLEEIVKLSKQASENMKRPEEEKDESSEVADEAKVEGAD